MAAGEGWGKLAPAVETPGRLAPAAAPRRGARAGCRVASAYPANTQEQTVVPSQGVNVPLFVQTRPEQHAVVGEHVWPTDEQLGPVWQVPLVEPVGMTQL